MHWKEKARNTLLTVTVLAVFIGVGFVMMVGYNIAPFKNPRLYQIDLETNGTVILYDGERIVGKGDIDSVSINELINIDNQ